MRKIQLVIVAMFASLSSSSSAFVDFFEGDTLGAEWSLSFNSTTRADTSWEPAVGLGKLRLEGFKHLVQNDSQGFATAYLTRDVAPVSGDFHLSMVFDWNMKNVNASNAMQQLRINALNSSGESVASFAYVDAWFGQSGRYNFSNGFDNTGTSSGANSLGYSSGGSVPVLLSRLDGTLNGKWNGLTVYEDLRSSSTDTITQIRIEASNYFYTPSSQGIRTMNIDTLEFNAVPEPASTTFIVSAMAALVVSCRRLKRK